jgi:peptidoglycan/LPS O-acetylase OafA/YrhL
MTAAVQLRSDLPALTGIRGLAAWWVVLYHIRGGAAAQLPPEVIALLAKGYLAVDLFFILSGFVLWLNYSDRLCRERLVAAPQFLSRRIARIWPLHLVILAGAVSFASALELAGRPNPDQFPWAELPLHILLVQNWGFTDSLSWNDPAWSISCELAAYLMFPFLMLAADWRRFPPAVLVMLILLLAAGLHLLMAVGGAATLGDDIPRFGIARALAEFSMGTILCALWLRWKEAGAVPIVASAAVAALALGSWLAGLAAETLAVPIAFASLLILIALTADRRANPLGWRPLHYLGEISYATYLVHYLLFIAFKLLLVDDPTRIPLPLLGLFLLLALVASAALYHGVERPAQRLLNRAYDMAALRLRRVPAD